MSKTIEEFIQELESNPEKRHQIGFLDDEQAAYYTEFCLQRKQNLDTVYHHAMMSGKVSLLKRMPDDFDYFYAEGTRLISTALCKGNVDIFDFLLEKGMDINMELTGQPFYPLGSSLLSSVLFTLRTPGCLDIAIKLIDNGACITTGDKRTKVIVKTLVMSDSAEIFDRLVIAGLDLHYYQRKMWKEILAQQSWVYLNGPGEIKKRLYDMGFPLPWSVTTDHIEKTIKLYNEVHNSESGIARATNNFIKKIENLWKSYGEKGKEIEFPYFEESSEEEVIYENYEDYENYDDYDDDTDSEEFYEDYPD
jgi:hypothetical protein